MKFHHNNPFGFRNVILLLLVSCAAALLVASVSAATGVTISADGSQAYYLGEKVVLRGQNTHSDSTYLFITGPNLPATGAKITAPATAAVSGNADTFTVVKTKSDASWEYPWYLAGLRLDAGSYTLYAASGPDAEDRLADVPYDTTSVIIKKPFITAGISPSTVSKGQPFMVTGFAEGIPRDVQLWIFGDNHVFTTKIPVHQDDASFSLSVDPAISGKLPAGQNYLIVQHPMADNQFDFVVSGDYVRDMKVNNGTNVFRFTGPGSLQGIDAADALSTAISDRAAHDPTVTNDTYTIIPVQITDAGSPAPVVQPPATADVPRQIPTSPLQYATFGAIVLMLGIVAWKQR